MSVIYKILFEVKLLHEYYLTRIKGDNIFDGADADARNVFLLEQFVLFAWLHSERDKVHTEVNRHQ